MGDLYRARDACLDRDVPLKTLAADMVADVARLERLSREARAPATLNHPNIVTIFSTQESDGVPFPTPALLEGKSLDRVLGIAPYMFPELVDGKTHIVKQVVRSSTFTGERLCGFIQRRSSSADYS